MMSAGLGRNKATQKSRLLLHLLMFGLLVKLCAFSLAVRYNELGQWAFQSSFANLEAYQDFRLAYVPLASNFISGKTPYQNFSYAYPPLFLYLLAPFASNSLPSWTLALPFVVLDAASVVPVYLIARKLTGHREALIASITFAIAPINLWYNDFLWLNPPPMTFFILLATYAFLSERYTSSFACLAVATLFKQIALSLFPVFFTTLLIKSVRKEVIRDSLLYGAICFLGSLPYIVTIPRIYLSSLGLPGIAPEWPMSTYQFSSPTSLAIAFGASFYEPAKFLLGVALLISFEILCFRIYKGRSTSDISFLTSITYALLLFHALFPRGIYKYYCAAITPFSLISVRNRKTALAFLGLNLLLLVIPRVFTPWLLLILLIPLCIWEVRCSRTLVMPIDHTQSLTATAKNGKVERTAPTHISPRYEDPTQLACAILNAGKHL
jgi:4-amino-4-deoxy-L-arabinose transferase-like glycosyltransferase